MKNSYQISENEPLKWDKFSKNGILAGKFLVIIFLLCLLAIVTSQLISPPYSVFLIGIEISISSILCFKIIRRHTFKPTFNLKLPENFNAENKQTVLLWNNITYDINKFEAGSKYYFKSVRIYKYTTIILAGLSTIILGLDLEDVKIGIMNYASFSKNVALIIGAVITVYTSIMTYWNIEKYWLINKTVVNKLRALRDDIEYLQISHALNNDRINDKIDEYKKIKETFYEYWEGALAERDSASAQDTNT